MGMGNPLAVRSLSTGLGCRMRTGRFNVLYLVGIFATFVCDDTLFHFCFFIHYLSCYTSDTLHFLSFFDQLQSTIVLLDIYIHSTSGQCLLALTP